MHLELLTTAHCSLCDRALDLLLGTDALKGATLTTIDIALDDSLMDEFGERIPVLRAGDRCLDWPFSADDAAALVKPIP